MKKRVTYFDGIEQKSFYEDGEFISSLVVKETGVSYELTIRFANDEYTKIYTPFLQVEYISDEEADRRLAGLLDIEF